MAARPENNRLKVLLVEDHVAIARLTAKLIEEVQCEVIGPARCVSDALRLATEKLPDMALVDLGLPDGAGEELISLLQARGVYCAVASAYPRDFKQVDGLRHVPWLEKPITLELLQELVNQAAARKVDS